MPSNSTVIASLEAQPVPEDMLCVRDLQDIVDRLPSVLRVVGLASQSAGSAFTTNNTASQALETANAAQAQVQALAGQIPQRRFTDPATPVALAAGDSVVPFTWTPALPDTNYEVRCCVFGPAASGASYCWHVQDASRTTSSVSVRFSNVPAGRSVIFIAEQLTGGS